MLIDGILFAALTLYPVVLLRGQLARMLKPRRSGWWARLWKVFEWKIFGMARLTGRTKLPLADSDRTEVVLGDGARRLFDELPPALQREFAALPNVVERLEHLAERLRLSDAADAPARRRTTLLALESVRLEVLRLLGGSDASGELTRNLDDAEALSRRIDGLMAAHADAAAALESADVLRTPVT
jgi:hypothetical protein